MKNITFIFFILMFASISGQNMSSQSNGSIITVDTKGEQMTISTPGSFTSGNSLITGRDETHTFTLCLVRGIGFYSSAPNPADLAQMYEEVGESIPTAMVY
ncbi:MAG: hypothetical protein HY606_11805 [Planctomycetes bacterium]|nr:hypothetical protein [Planctomycetota bacterium]